MLARLAPFLAHRRWPLLLAGLALLLGLPALDGGLALDDYVLRAKLVGEMPIPAGSSPYLELFRFLPGSAEVTRPLIVQGVLPWWIDPEVRGAFLRPLAAASHALDFALWPDSYLWHHLHSLLWCALAVLAVALLYRRVAGGAMAAAGLAGLMFAVDDAHYMPAAWLANRNAAMALAFGALAVMLHVAWRRRGGLHRLALALAAALAGLLSGELALGAVAYIAAYQIALDPLPWPRRLAGLAPQVALVLAWGAVYTALGFGSGGSGMYVDPLREPLHFLQVMATRIPALMLAQWTQLSSDGLMVLPQAAHLGYAAAGLALLAGLGLLFAPLLRERAEARFWALGMLLSTVPVCGVIPMDRLLLFPGVGAFGLLACQLDRLGWLGSGEVVRPGGLRRWSLKALVVIHALLVLPVLPLRIVAFQHLEELADQEALTLPSDRRVAGQTFVFVNAYEITYIYTPLVRRAHGLVLPGGWTALAQVMTDLEISRPDRRSLVISPQGGYMAIPGERLLRGPQRPFHPGQRISTRAHEAEVLRVTPDGRPAEVRFDFRVPLEHPSLRWFHLVRGRVRPFALPGVGGRKRVERGFPSLGAMLTGG
jgi:hypothetical protein